MKRKRLTKKEQDELDYKELREYKSRFSKQFTYVVFTCGLSLTLIGAYFTIVDQNVSGITLAGRFTAGGQTQTVSGPFILILGILILIIRPRT